MAKRKQNISSAERARRSRQARINFGFTKKSRSVSHMGKKHKSHHRSSGGRMGGFGKIAVDAGLGVAVGAGTQLVASKLPIVSGFAPYIAIWTAYKAGGTSGAIAFALTSGVLNNVMAGGLGSLLSTTSSTSNGATFA